MDTASAPGFWQARCSCGWTAMPTPDEAIAEADAERHLADQQPPYAGLYFHADGSFRSPELAAQHATLIQGGFSTPCIEAERMIRDGGLGRQVALDWLKANS